MYILMTLAIAGFLFAAPGANTAAAPATDSSSFGIVQVQGPEMKVGPNVLTAGGTAEITYTDASKPGQSIKITIDDGNRTSPTIQSVTIVLDASGKGSATWAVPEWDLANFNATGVVEVTRPII